MAIPLKEVTVNADENAAEQDLNPVSNDLIVAPPVYRPRVPIAVAAGSLGRPLHDDRSSSFPEKACSILAAYMSAPLAQFLQLVPRT